MNRKLGICAIVTGLCLTVLQSHILAATPNIINYQGRLTDATGAPVADGATLVKFTIYDAPTAGTALWSSNFQTVNTVNGLFSYELGANVTFPNNLFADTSRWLGITVGTDPEISPRTKLTSQPYTLQTVNADTAAIAATVFDNSINGAKIANNTVGSADVKGSQVQLRVTGAASSGEALTGINQDGTVTTAPFSPLAHDHDSAYVNVTGDVMSGALGFSNLSTPMTYIYQSGVSNPSHMIAGHSPANPDWGMAYDDSLDEIRFQSRGFLGGVNTNVAIGLASSGDNSVRLPTSAISAPEILDEPGIVQDFNANNSILFPFFLSNGTMKDLATVTITIPSDGYVFLQGRTTLALFGTKNDNLVDVQIDETSGGGLISGAYSTVGSFSYLTTSSYFYNCTSQRTYFKSAGTYTFRLEAEFSSGDVNAGAKPTNSYLTALFIPSSYGTVRTASSSSDGFPDAKLIQSDNGEGNRSATPSYKVDLRALELKATKAREEALKAELELRKAQAQVTQER